MNKTFGIILVIGYSILFKSTYAYSAIHVLDYLKTTLSGRITDHATGEPLPGVSIYLPDLKTGTVTDINGKYILDNLPQSKVLVQVSYIGYKLIAVTLDLTILNTRDFAMDEAIAELHEIVVTGESHPTEKNRTSTPITTVPTIKLLQTTSSNIIDAIASLPGISQVTSGSGISKPVIRGLGYNRVVTVMDGIRQEGQQWGDEHGIEIDEFAVNKMEILKGPASLTYGSDAMAGVINLLTAPTLPEGKIKGNLLANYQTNNGLIAYSANFTGNQKGLIWDLRYSDKAAHAYQNINDGYVFNSGYKENTLGGIIGVNKSWGYAHLHFSSYHLAPGIIEGQRDALTGKFIKPVAINDSTEGTAPATNLDYKSYTPLTPYQQIRHLKVVSNNSFIIGNGSLKATLGYQQNDRQEFADILKPNQYGLYFDLHTINYELRYILPEKNNIHISFGTNGMRQSSRNRGSEFLIPDYRLFDIGFFATAKKTIDKFDISTGLRYDTRNERGDDLFVDGIHQFQSFHSSFSGISGSAGATYQFSEKVFAKLNVSRGYRAPNIAELGANGIHEGTVNYIIGVPTLKPENSIQFDFALGLNAQHITAELNLFSNTINHFIFLQKIASRNGGDSLTQGYSTFKYASGNANLTGGELSIDIHPHPLDWLHFENSFSFVRSIQKNQPDSTRYLPFTPPAKYASELKAVSKKMGNALANAYIQIGIDKYFNQNNYYKAFNTETATPGYTLLNAGLGADVLYRNKTLFSVYINVNNLTDVAYQSHLSRLKYGDFNNATGRVGVYNTGRNISIKVLMPIDFSK